MRHGTACMNAALAIVAQTLVMSCTLRSTVLPVYHPLYSRVWSKPGKSSCHSANLVQGLVAQVLVFSLNHMDSTVRVYVESKLL